MRIYGLEENPDETLQEKIIGLAKEELGVEIKEEEIEIARRIRQTRRSQNKPRSVQKKHDCIRLMLYRKRLNGLLVRLKERQQLFNVTR